MVTPTRVDEDLQEYYRILQEKEHIEDGDIRHLLDVYRTKFGVDLVYVGEVAADRKGIGFPYISAPGEGMELQGKSKAMEIDGLDRLAGSYDKDGLCDDRLALRGEETDASALHYGIRHEGMLINDIGMVDLCQDGPFQERIWSPEERAAIQKLGRILRPVLYMERDGRVRAWEKGRQAQQLSTLEAIFSTTDCGMVRHSQDGKRVFGINQAALNLLGYTSEEQLMADGFDLIAMSVLEEDKPKLRASIRQLDQVGDSTDIEYRVRHKDGTVLDIIGKIQLLEENGELIYQRFLFDHTAKKALEARKALQEQRRQMEMIRALCAEYGAVYLVDLDTGMAATCRLDKEIAEGHGSIFCREFSFQEKMERYVEEHVYGPDKELLRQAVSVEQLTSSLSQKEASHTNFRALGKGQIEYVQMKAVRSGSWSSARRIVVGFRSVDEEIRHEMDQKKLVEGSLAQAQRANAVKSTFLANMSHDIRTPMNAILGFTTLATIHIDQKEKLQEYLGKIMASGNHLLALINEILDMSHLESGDVSLDERACSLPEILQELQNILQVEISAKRQQFSIDMTGVTDEEIYCDGLRLSQVFLNLLDNAIKFTGDGGQIVVTVTETPCAAVGWADYRFRIKDNGVGMSRGFIAHAFEPFEREYPSTISRVQGTGLGLTLTKTLVDMMGGTIQVESEKGKGTEFIVSLSFRLAGQTRTESGNGRARQTESGSGRARQAESGNGRARQTESGSGRTREAGSSPGREVECDDGCAWQGEGRDGSIREAESGNGRVWQAESGSGPTLEAERDDGCVRQAEAGSSPGREAECAVGLVRPEAGGQKPVVRILLTEDNELNQEIAMEILTEAGYQVDVADNGQIAVEKLQKAGPGHYHIVLMDLQMPVMNGYDAAKNIRKLEDPQVAAIPILAVSANAFEEDKRMAIESGMNGHFPKPIDAERLLAAIEELLATCDKAHGG